MYIFNDYFRKKADTTVDIFGYQAGWEQYLFLNLCVLFTEISYLVRVLFSNSEIEMKTADNVGRWEVQHFTSTTSIY